MVLTCWYLLAVCAFDILHLNTDLIIHRFIVCFTFNDNFDEGFGSGVMHQ